MSEQEWHALVRAGRQAEHQALELLRLERDPLEWTWPTVMEVHRWAIHVVAGWLEVTDGSRPVRRPAWLSPAAE